MGGCLSTPAVWDKNLYELFRAPQLEDPANDPKNPANETHPHPIQLLKLSEGKKWLALDGQESNILVVRRWMSEFWDKMFYQPDPAPKVSKRYVLIGTPGIGKSASMNYFLWRYLNAPNGASQKRWRYVVALLPTKVEYYVFDTKSAAATRSKLAAHDVNVFIDRLGEKNVLVLHDLGRDPPIISHSLPAIVFTSPKMEKTHEYMKSTPVFVYYVPVPDDDEMECMARCVFNGLDYRAIWGSQPVVVKSGRTVEGWRDVAYFVGNVPRHVFAPEGVGTCLNHLESKLNSLDLEKLSKNSAKEFEELSDSIIYIVPSKDPQFYTRRLRPGWVTEQIDERLKALPANQDVTVILIALGFLGHYQEPIVHALLDRGIGFLEVDTLIALTPKQENHTTREPTSVPDTS